MREDIEEYVVQPEGELDLATVEPLREQWAELIDRVRPVRFVIDLSRVTFVDGAALGTFIGVHKRRRKHGGCVLITDASPNVAKVFP
jgi:anti-anti-sigma factor